MHRSPLFGDHLFTVAVLLFGVLIPLVLILVVTWLIIFV
jgi:hypothetical protein